jgi:hypothetical protein
MVDCQRLPMWRCLNGRASIAFERYLGARCNVLAISPREENSYGPSRNIEYFQKQKKKKEKKRKEQYTALTFGKAQCGNQSQA